MLQIQYVNILVGLCK